MLLYVILQITWQIHRNFFHPPSPPPPPQQQHINLNEMLRLCFLFSIYIKIQTDVCKRFFIRENIIKFSRQNGDVVSHFIQTKKNFFIYAQFREGAEHIPLLSTKKSHLFCGFIHRCCVAVVVVVVVICLKSTVKCV